MSLIAPTAAVDHGDDVLVLSSGDVQLPLHQPAAAPKARRADQPYRPPAGDAALREAITRYAADAACGGAGRAGFASSQVVVTPGARQAIFITLLSILAGERREVLIPAPYWASYPRLVEMAGGVPVIVEGERGRSPDPDTLAARTTDRTALIILNSPRNPDGVVTPADMLRRITDWAGNRGLTLLFDQVYRGVALQERSSPTVTDLYPELPEHVVLIDGVTKSHALAGLRLGWAVGGRATAGRITATSSHLIGHTSGLVQDVGVELLAHGERDRRALGTRLASHLESALAELATIPGLRYHRPEGGIFLFPDVREWLAHAAPDEAVADMSGWLRTQHGLAAVDGAAFGAPGHLRLSFAVPSDLLLDGLGRLRHALTS
ncbi:pyridoxal phosphate-dependent aminotransferase [Streptomyces goshikiensis]|uniref:pyridoxal phosphate-dependent aminotransferase n=1 Tax=Streptomyces goshikiensis TaxID=1942 RepID=UPI0036AC62CF